MSKFKVLLVEDDLFKKEEILSQLNLISLEVDVSYASSVQQSITQICAEVFDLIILDMALPSHDIGQSSASPLTLLAGGVELLHELSYTERSDPVLILTQYPDVPYDNQIVNLMKFKAIINADLDLNIIEACHFEKVSSNWKMKFNSVVKDLYDKHSNY